MEEYVEKTLSNGTVLRLVDVPTMLTMDAMRHYPELSYPEEPGMVEIPTKVGIERRAAREGDPLYDEWKVKADEIDKLRNQFLQDFPWEAGVLGWKLEGEKRFTNQPPKNWKAPERYVRYGAAFSPFLGVRRLRYIRYVACVSILDFNEVWRVVNRGMLISQEEVDDTVATFQGDTPPPTVA